MVFPTAVSSSKLYLAAIKFGFIGVEGTDGYWRKKTWLQVIRRLPRGGAPIGVRLSAGALLVCRVFPDAAGED